MFPGFGRLYESWPQTLSVRVPDHRRDLTLFLAHRFGSCWDFQHLPPLRIRHETHLTNDCPDRDSPFVDLAMRQVHCVA